MIQMPDINLITHALNMSPVGVVMLDKNKKVSWINQIMCDFLATPADQITGTGYSEMTSQYLDSFAEHPDLWKVDNSISRQNRWLICMDTPPEKPENGQTVHYFVDVSEIMKLKTEIRNLKDQLDNNSTSDTLTGLLNKRSLLQSLEPQVSRSRRYNNPLTLIILKVDSFKSLTENVTAATDQVLTAISFYLRDQMRWVDLVGRTDDDEFTLILPETRIDDANILVDKINIRLANISLSDTPEVTIKVNAKFGIAEWGKGDDTSMLLRKAKDNLTFISEKSVA